MPPRRHAKNALRSQPLSPSHSRPTNGSIDAVESLTRDDLKRLHAERFAPSVLTAAIAGDVDPSRARDGVRRAFGEWQRPAPAPVLLPPVQTATTRRRMVIPMMNKAQADLA